MTREQAKKNLIALGTLAPTEEQITNYLKQVEGDQQELSDLREKADKYDEAQRLLDEERNKSLTAEEKLQAAIDAANTSKSDFVRKSNRLEVEKILVKAGLTEDEYSGLIDGIVSEDAATSTSLANSLVSLITGQREAIAAKVKDDILKDNPLPPSGGDLPGDKKPEAIRVAEELVVKNESAMKEAKTALNYYSGGK